MSTGRSIVSTCPARAAIAGNPSDGYGGAVVATTIPALRATASGTEADALSIDTRDPELGVLLAATAEAFGDHVGHVPPIRLSASTAIPRSVGLAGSSALVIAALRCLGAWTGHRWAVAELAELALSVERDRLGITAGLQDRLVQAADALVAMTFDPISHTVLTSPAELPFWIAWSDHAAQSSDIVHRSIRRRFDGGDELVRGAMRELAEQADRARAAIVAGDRRSLAAAIDASFDLRVAMVDVGDAMRELVELGRTAGAAVNSAGSGGSVLGLARDPAHLDVLQTTYEAAGVEFLAID